MLNALTRYRETLFDTEARIIAEDSTHIVVSVRIAKESIAENLPFFAALAASAKRPGAYVTPRRAAAFGALAFMADAACRVLVHPVSLALNWALDLAAYAGNVL